MKIQNCSSTFSPTSIEIWNVNFEIKINATKHNSGFNKLRATWFQFLHRFSLSFYRLTEFLQVKPQILKPAKRYRAF
jgi:hypothetical protein